MNKDGCIFCQIASGELPAEKVYETARVVAFKDIRPQAPVHILVIPREHIETVNHIQPEHRELIGEMFLAAQEIAKKFGVADSGYRTVFNCNRDAGQDVYHLHLHVLAGRKMTWPPG
ncbi:histidine triad nucleotide-binding protein [candidate division KSB1 bacterium 4484_87]|nr:MAG: histidine triad nucleotide-binding protein [candidate division KSB1 bacterium 4484_87]